MTTAIAAMMIEMMKVMTLGAESSNGMFSPLFESSVSSFALLLAMRLSGSDKIDRSGT